MSKDFDFTVPPITYFGRKHKIAEQVWSLFGDDVKIYVEPFAGSLACFLRRPKKHKNIISRLNDFDGLVVNFWRAVMAEPEVIAEWCTRPVSEADLHASHIFCVQNKKLIIPKLCGDINFYDVNLAKCWAYGINCWIGGLWCNSNGPWIQDPDSKMMVNKKSGESYGGLIEEGVRARKPTSGCKGILSQVEEVISAKKPTGHHKGILSQVEEGISAQKPIGHHQGILSQPDEILTGAFESKLNRNLKWLNHLADSLMRATITCGDWKRVLTKSYTHDNSKMTAIFLDPPYDNEIISGNKNVYGVNNETNISADVRQWCIENSNDKLLKIVLCGYDFEHDELLDHGFTKMPWIAKSSSGYRQSTETKQEMLWVKM